VTSPRPRAALALAALVAAALVAAAALAACSPLFAPQRDPSRFFALSVAVEGSPSESAAKGAGRTIGVGPVRLPEYLDRNQICVRLSETELSYSRTNRWAAPLRESFLSVLVQDLGILLERDRVLVYPWTADTVDLQIEILVRHFESHRSGANRLVARWTVRDEASGEPILVRDSSLERRSESDGPGGDVAALSATLADLAGEIAAALRALP
jgi:uncharacterized protein